MPLGVSYPASRCPAERDQLGLAGSAPGARTTTAVTASPQCSCGRPIDRRLVDGGVLAEHRLDAQAGDVLAAGLHDVLVAVEHDPQAVVVIGAAVARVEPAVAERAARWRPRRGSSPTSSHGERYTASPATPGGAGQVACRRGPAPSRPAAGWARRRSCAAGAVRAYSSGHLSGQKRWQEIDSVWPKISNASRSCAAVPLHRRQRRRVAAPPSRRRSTVRQVASSSGARGQHRVHRPRPSPGSQAHSAVTRSAAIISAIGAGSGRRPTTRVPAGQEGRVRERLVADVVEHRQEGARAAGRSRSAGRGSATARTRSAAM